ncbi:large ribosomal subunit protein uL13m isoform 2-T2 [Trichechus inunguis]
MDLSVLRILKMVQDRVKLLLEFQTYKSRYQPVSNKQNSFHLYLHLLLPIRYYFEQWATFARVWYLLDGKMQPPGKLAAMASIKLQGLHKPMYHQLSDCGDHVVIMNTRHIAFSGNKWEQKVYSSHTGYPGGFRQVTAAQLHQKDPVAIVKLAIYGMLPKNLHRRTMMQRLHLFPDEDIPEDILKNLVEELPQPRKVPRRLDEYTQEEIEAFPRVWSP